MRANLKALWIVAMTWGVAGCESLREPPIQAPPSSTTMPAYPPSVRPAPQPKIVTPTSTSDIALLLPLSGRQAGSGATVREGFMTAWYQTAQSERPRIRVYDTAEMSAASAISRATQDGAGLIVGPLMRDEVVAAAESTAARPPVLALNYLPGDHAAPQAFYQFALSPENEARVVAQRVLAEGRKRGVALVPEGDWGTRVLAAFKQELEAGGGILLSSMTFEPARMDFAPEITQMLRLSDSRSRHKRLESVLGTKLEFEPRRRQDIDFIFAPSQASLTRLVRPQLKFHYAGDIPTYATSDAFEPDPTANEDLDGLMFPDMPWMLGGGLAQSVRAAANEAWGNSGPRRNRLFAFGFDAYRLALTLRGQGTSGVNLDGLTGRLTIDPQRRVHQELAWAKVRNGQAQVMAEAAQ